MSPMFWYALGMLQAKRRLHNAGGPSPPDKKDPKVIATTKEYPPSTSAFQALMVLGLGAIMVLNRDYPKWFHLDQNRLSGCSYRLPLFWFLPLRLCFFSSGGGFCGCVTWPGCNLCQLPLPAYRHFVSRLRLSTAVDLALAALGFVAGVYICTDVARVAGDFKQ